MKTIKQLFNFNRIRTPLTLWFLIVALVPLLIGLFITYNQRKEAIQQITFEKLTAIRDLKTQELNNWIKEREGDMSVMSGYTEIRELENILEKKNKSLKDIEKVAVTQELMSSYLRYFKDYDEIFIIGATSGLIEISSDEASIGLSMLKNNIFTTPLNTQEFFIKDIHFSSSTNKPILGFSLPIFSLTEKNKVIGVFVVRVNLNNSLYPLLRNRVGLGETGETLIVNETGFALNELRWYENAPLKLKIEAEPTLNAVQGKTGITATKDYRNKDVLTAYTYIPKTKWGFVVKQDLFELNEPMRAEMGNFIWLFFITAFIVTLMVFWIVKAITKPIVEINLTAKKIKGGFYSARNNIHRNDELGSLAISINEMAESIESNINIDSGVSAITKTMLGKSSLKKFSTELLQQLMKISKANMSTFYVLNSNNTNYEHITSIGANEELLKPFSAKNPEGEFGNVLSEKQIYYLQNIPENTIFKFKTTAGDIVPKEIITIPLVLEDKVVALISLINITSFSNESYEAIKKSWQAINLSYSELKSNLDNKLLADNLSILNENLKAQSEELQIQSIELQRGSEELKEHNIELEMQKIQLNEANQLKTTFLSNMSHELRTPLNSVIALSGVLNRKLVNQIHEEEYSYISIIERNGKHLLSLINDILDISRIESGREEIEITKFNVNNLIAELVDMLHPQAAQKNIKLIQNDSNAEMLVTSDVGKCRHIFQNLIGNAIKFTDVGKVEITVKKIKDNIVITVIDTGIGIPNNMLSNIFDEFRQVDGSTSKRFEGTGLGLAIVKKYTNLLEGLISVKSIPDKGSEFTLTLPLIYTGENSNKKVETTKFNKGIKHFPKSIQENSTKTILVVEDTEAAIIQIKDILEEKGYTILVARDGEEALEIINHTIPDGIMLDLMMPRVDGFEVLKTLREAEKTALVPVLILTAKHITKKDLKFLKRNNIHQLIQKGDIKRYELLDTISNMVFTEIEKQPKRVLQIIKGKPVVLVVEDNPDNMITVKALLRDDYTVIEAFNGEKGVEMAKKHKPNIILMDIALPKMDGFEAFKAIRKLPELAHIPITALTASAMIQDRETILAFGFDAYITKPIDENLFYNTIKKLLYGN